jgi:NADH dehydrogenase/NADH:ubiquinone oxidoreductase subunit G
MGILFINGIEVQNDDSKTIYELARAAGISIPTLCHLPRRESRAVCRICVVEIAGRPGLVTACSTRASDGMEILTHSETVLRTRRVLMEFILAEHGEFCANDQVIRTLAQTLGVTQSRFSLPARDHSRYRLIESEYIKLDVAKCIHCDRCIRACADRNVITRKGFGNAVTFAFDDDVAIDKSSCIQCGDCVHACPSGAISAAS